jgi:archaellin
LLLLSNKKLVGSLVAAIAVCVAVAGYAFTASNTVPNASLGQGANVISGYAISGIGYNQNATNPGNIDSVAFTITPAAAGTVTVQLASGGVWYSCTNTAGSVSCATTSPQATASLATSLNVVAGA